MMSGQRWTGIIMDSSALQDYLYERIPLSRAMEVVVEEVGSDTLTLSAPLLPNLNHRDSVFGGSANAVALLAAWSLLFTRLKKADLANTLVIQQNTMHYDLPITGRFTAVASLAETADWDKFIRTFQRRGKARIEAVTQLVFDGQPAGNMVGSFVAVSR